MDSLGCGGGNPIAVALGCTLVDAQTGEWSRTPLPVSQIWQ